MNICIFDCDYDEGIDNTALKIKEILDREENCESTIFRAKENIFPESTKQFNGFIVTGSAKTLEDKLEWMDKLRIFIKTKKQVLGICFGHQLIADFLGGTVEINKEGNNFGYEFVKLTEKAVNNPLFRELDSPLHTFSSHNNYVSILPQGSILLATNHIGVQAFQKGNYYGVQFHPDISPDMAKRLGEMRNKDSNYPGDDDANDSWKINKKILKNFVNIVKNSE